MSNSGLYGGGSSVSKNSKLNEVNDAKAKEFDRMQLAEKNNFANNEAFNAGVNEGSNTAYMDIMQKLDASSQYAPIMEGSPEADYYDIGTAQGLAYEEPQEPGLLDSVLNGAANWFSSDNAPAQQSQLQREQEDEQVRYESEQAGLAELKQLLNK